MLLQWKLTMGRWKLAQGRGSLKLALAQGRRRRRQRRRWEGDGGGKALQAVAAYLLPRISREGRGKARPGRNGLGLRNQLRRMEVGIAACDRLTAAISSRLACHDSSLRHITFTGTNRLNQDGLNSKNTQHTRA